MFARQAPSAFRGALRAAARTTAPRSFATAAARQPVANRLGGSRTALALAVGVATVGYSAFAAYREPFALEGARTIAGEYGTTSERSFIMIKPDGVSRQIVGKIIDRFESRGYKLVAIKSVMPSKELAQEHYIDLAQKPFYKGLVAYITSGTPVVAMVWEGKDVIRQGRRMVGATNPLESDPGSVRGQYAVSVGRNIIHASDGFDSATKEIGLWFDEKELANYKPAAWDEVMADN